MIEDPVWLQGKTYAAREDRQLIAAIFGEGVLSGFAVSQRGAGANMSVDVAAGWGIIQGDDQANQGNYLVRSTATENLSGFTAPGSNSRIDSVVLQINDPNAGGAVGDNMVITRVAGTVAASPVAPATPASAILLATVGPFTSSTTAITNAMITDARSYATLANDVVDDAQGTRLGTSAATASALMRRDASGRAKFAQGIAAGDAVVFPVTTAQISDFASGTLDSGAVSYARSAGIVHVWTTTAWSGVGVTLPAGFRPSANLITPATTLGSAPAAVNILTTGAISHAVGSGATVFSVSFKAA